MIHAFRSLVDSLKERQNTLKPSELAELRPMTATTGQGVGQISSSGSLIGQMSGISLEDASLRGMPDGAASPYDGMTVGQARESIIAERQALRHLMGDHAQASRLLEQDPHLMSRCIDRFRLLGEVETMKRLLELDGMAR